MLLVMVFVGGWREKLFAACIGSGLECGGMRYFFFRVSM